MANQELTIEDIFRALNCFNESQRVEFLAQKTIEMKKILPKVDVLEALRDTTVINAGDTSNRHPCCNIEAWHKYWQIATSEFGNQMICSSCGKPIFSDVTDENCRKVSQGLDEDGKPDTPDKHCALGGHVFIEQYSTEKYFITPLCPHCNNKYEKTIPLRKGSLLVKEEKAEIQ